MSHREFNVLEGFFLQLQFFSSMFNCVYEETLKKKVGVSFVSLYDLVNKFFFPSMLVHKHSRCLIPHTKPSLLGPSNFVCLWCYLAWQASLMEQIRQSEINWIVPLQ